MIQDKYGEYKLSSYEPVTLTLPDFTVSEQEILAEMQRIASRHSTNITVDPHPVRADDLVLINIITKEGSSIFPGLTHDSVDVQLGVGALPEEIETAMLGHMVGDYVDATFNYTDYSQVESDREAPADGGCGAGEAGEPEVVELTSHIEIKAIRKLEIPEVTDEWVAKNIALSNTVDEFRERTQKKLFDKRRRDYAYDIEKDIMREIGKRLDEEPPSDVVDKLMKQMLRELDRFLEQYEMDRATYLATQGLDDITFAEQIQRDARERIAEDIALASWATHFGIKLDDKDIDFMFGEPTPERTYEARVEAEQSGQIETFKDLALRAKVTEDITRNAVFLKPNGGEDKSFEDEIQMKFKKLEMVRNHATAAPMKQPPMVPVQ